MPLPALRLARPDDAVALAILAQKTFHDTFVDGFQLSYPQADLQSFYARSYALAAVRAWIDNPLDQVFVLDLHGELVGYAQAGENSLPFHGASAGDGELKRLYLTTASQGQGLGRRLLETCLTWLGARPVFIGVWKHNAKAIKLYGRYGFEQVGAYGFMVGETRDEEVILGRAASERTVG